mgnify:CR=1 FL=1
MKLIFGIIVWAVAFVARLALILLGLPAVAFSLVADGVRRTPRMFKFWADAEAETWWDEDDIEWWMYLYVPLVAALAWYAYGHWHPLVAIYFIFTTASALLIVPSKERFAKFWWFAIRNPVEGLDGKLKQPIPEVQPNPDKLVRGGEVRKASRFMQSGIFWEYWFLKKSGGHYFEFRIGWKFVDGNSAFVPTFPIGLRD